MTAQSILKRMDSMASAVQLMASMLGTRIDRTQLAERMGVHRNTLTNRLNAGADIPRPGKDGKWLLSDVIAWEQKQ